VNALSCEGRICGEEHLIFGRLRLVDLELDGVISSGVERDRERLLRAGTGHRNIEQYRSELGFLATFVLAVMSMIVARFCRARSRGIRGHRVVSAGGRRCLDAAKLDLAEDELDLVQNQRVGPVSEGARRRRGNVQGSGTGTGRCRRTGRETQPQSALGRIGTGVVRAAGDYDKDPERQRGEPWYCADHRLLREEVRCREREAGLHLGNRGTALD
jgi:hypothetical protein